MNRKNKEEKQEKQKQICSEESVESVLREEKSVMGRICEWVGFELGVKE